MTWATFTAAVLEQLGTDGTRRGIDALRTRAIRDAVVDLQRFIPAFRDGHTTRYDEADLTTKDYAQVGTMPTGAKPTAFYVVSEVPDADGVLPDPDCGRNALDFCAWNERQARMVCNQYGTRDYLYAVSPTGRVFMVHPLVNDETYLLVVWNGIKTDFEDADVVPWPENADEAVAAYVKWKILLQIDRRLDLAAQWFDLRSGTGIYPSARLKLFRDQRETQDAGGNDEEYGVTSEAAPAPPA
jgi:hypothetical protein